MENQVMSCCFTGYRPSKFPFELNKNNKHYLDFENRLTREVFSAYSCGVKTFISGMAMGFDIVSAETVLALKEVKPDVTLICAVPFKGQEKGYPPEWNERYIKILDAADNIIYVSQNYDRGCYFKRNKYMVDNSDIVMTWFDGRTGGTANTIEYAKRRGRVVINLNIVRIKPRFSLKHFHSFNTEKDWE